MTSAAPKTPLSAYVALMSLFTTSFVGFRFLARRLGRPLPERIDERDVLLFGVATHWLSRTLTRDRVTAPLRAPFTTAGEPGGPVGAPAEAPEGQGLRKAVGQLLTCQFCSAPWVASTFVNVFTIAPRTTRLVASVCSVTAVADLLHLGYEAAKARQDPA